MPNFTEWDNIIFNILFILEAPWIWIYNVFLPLPNDDSDIDFLSVGQAILLFFGPFLSIALYYFIGLSLTMIYNSIQKK